MKSLESELNSATFIYQSSWFLYAPEGTKCIEFVAKSATEREIEFAFNLSAPMIIEGYQAPG